MRIPAVLVLGVVSLGCGRGISPDPSAERPARNALVIDAERATTEMGASAPALPSDGETLSRAPFVSLQDLCEVQKTAVVPRLREAERELHERGEDKVLVPSCDENQSAMKGVKLSLGAPFYDATAITFEDGYGQETDLVVRTLDGWVRAPVVLSYDGYMDPGCPSIVRGRGLVEARVESVASPSGGPEKPMLVVVTEADRGWEHDDSFGSMIFTQARTCRIAAGKIASGTAETVGARTEMFTYDTRKPLPVKPVFRTTYTVDGKGAVHPAKQFDLEAVVGGDASKGA